MGMTIAELVANPAVGNRVLAGEAGLDRAVGWAHVCEVPDPWNYLSAGDLLLTDGYSIPADEAAQVTFIETLHQAGIVGISVGADMHAPPWTAQALELADQLGFPILETAYHVPFVMLVRAVADGNAQGDGRRAVKLLRLYDALRRIHVHEDVDALLDNLSVELHARLHVVSARTGQELLPSREPLPEDSRTKIVEHLQSDSRQMGSFGRITAEPGVMLVMPLAPEHEAVMVVRPERADAAPDILLLQHAATIVGLDVARRSAELVHQRVRRSELFQSLIDGTLAAEAGFRSLLSENLGDGPWVAVSLEAEAADAGTGSAGDSGAEPYVGPILPGKIASPSELMAQDAELPPHLELRTGNDTLLLIEASWLEEIRALAERERAIIGVSEPYQSPLKFGDAVREARWARESAKSRGAGSASYGDRPGLFLPRTVAEGEVVVGEVLGEVLAYDQERDAGLITSLQAYFDAGRSWQGAAQSLGIHRQTLVYRIRRVETLTGRSLRDLQGLAELYLAMRTLQLLQV